ESTDQEILAAATQLAFPCCMRILHNTDEARVVAEEAAEDYLMVCLSGWHKGDEVSEELNQFLGRSIELLLDGEAPCDPLDLAQGALVTRLAKRKAECRMKQLWRSRRREQSLEAKHEDLLIGGLNDVRHRIQQTDFAAFVLRQLDRLRDDCRVLLTEYLLREKSQEDIARQYGVSQATISRRLHRAMEMLRRQLGLPAEV